jgi:hypothetical protein
MNDFDGYGYEYEMRYYKLTENTKFILDMEYEYFSIPQ